MVLFNGIGVGEAANAGYENAQAQLHPNNGKYWHDRDIASVIRSVLHEFLWEIPQGEKPGLVLLRCELPA